MQKKIISAHSIKSNKRIYHQCNVKGIPDRLNVIKVVQVVFKTI